MRISKLTGISCLFLGLLILSDAMAQPWLDVGTRERAMGGAGVASATGGSALYWNPANLGRDSDNAFNIRLKTTSWDNTFFADAEARGDVIKNFDSLLGIFNTEISTLQTAFDTGAANATQVQRVFETVGLIGDLGASGEGLVGDVGGASVVKLGNFALSFRMLSYLSASATISLTDSSLADDAAADLSTVANGLGADDTPSNAFSINTLVPTLTGIGLTTAEANELAFQAEEALGANINDPRIQSVVTQVVEASGVANANTLDQNDSFILVRGIALQEISFGYGIPLFDNSIRIGIAPKVIVGRTFFRTFVVSDDSDGINDGDDIVEEFKDILDGAEKSENKFSVDAGIAWSPFKSIEFGLSGRNLIPTEFEFGPSPLVTLQKFELDPQVRAGVLFRPLGINWLKFAADIDVTTNSNSLFPNHSERILGGGVELTPKLWILQPAIRFGAFDNIAESNDSITFTGGLALRLGIFYLGADGRISAESTQIESSGKDIPDRAGFGVNFGINVKF